MEILLLVFFAAMKIAAGSSPPVNQRAQFGGLFFRPVNHGQQSLKLFVGDVKSGLLRQSS
jgi:hypothetical protein